MTVKELFEILEHEMNMGRGNATVLIWDIKKAEATDTIRDSKEGKFYILSGN